MAADTLTTVAAFTAAFFSLGGAVTAAVTASRTQKNQWKRTTTVEKVAKFLDHLDVLMSKMQELAEATGRYEDEARRRTTTVDDAEAKRSSLHREVTALDNMLLARISELELVVGLKSVEAAFEIRGILRSAIWISRPPGGANDKDIVIQDSITSITGARNKFVRAVRKDLGMPENKVTEEIERHLW